MITFSTASNADIPIIRDLAEKTWWPTYGPIQPHDKVKYLLQMFYSTEALEKVIEDGSQEFVLEMDNGTAVGFASYGERAEEPGIFKLYKLYVLPATHGKGYGRALLEDVKQRVKNHATPGTKCILDLNVYRGNPALKFYEKVGFRIIAEVNEPVGDYFFEDYVMRIEF